MILALRHASTDFNAGGAERVRGQLNIPLNAEGQQEASEAADRLKTFQDSGTSIRRILSCDLDRARQTADPVSQALGLPVYYSAALRTWNLGDLQGQPVEEAGPEIAALVQRMDEPPANGESYREFLARFLTFVAPFFHGQPDDVTLVITHGQNIRALRAWIGAGAKGLTVDTDEAANAEEGVEHAGLALAQPPDTFEIIDPKPSQGLS